MSCEQTLTGSEQSVKKSRIRKGPFHSQEKEEKSFRKALQTSNFN